MINFAKIGLILSFLFIVSLASWAAIPQIPSNCFSGKDYCSTNEVIRERGEKVIKVFVAARFLKSEYGSPSLLVDRYYDFAKWMDYAAGSDNLDMEYSEALYARVNGEEKRRHHVSYTAKAPWPVSKIKVKDLVQYDEGKKEPGALIYASFEGVKNFQDRSGVKMNWGEVFVVEQGKHYVVLFVNKVVPSISILPSVAAPYIERPMLDIFRGMFSLE